MTTLTTSPDPTEQGPTALDPAALGALGHHLVGDYLTPGQPEYDEHRKVYNAQIDRSPALIVIAEGQSDVQAAVDFARNTGLPVAVRGGGHSVAGHGTCDGGVLIDLRRMRGVLVLPDSGRVWAQGGVTLRDLDAQTQTFGLAVPTGQVSATGVAGLALGGGLGMLQRKYGLTCDNLIAARLVDAQGQLRHVDDQSDPELMWALRGGGGNFGAVTDFCFQAHRVGPIMLAGMVAWPVAQSEEVLAHLDRLITDAPLELSADIIYQFAPPLPVFPEEVRGQHLIGIFIRWCGDIAAGQGLVADIRSLEGAVLDAVAPVPLVEVQRMLDPLNPDGNQHRWTGEFLPAMDGRTRHALGQLGAALPNPMCIIEVIPYNGAPVEVAPDATAFSHRTPGYLIHILGQWVAAEQEESVLDWVARARTALTDVGFQGETYLNLIGEEETRERVTSFWRGPSKDRLQQVKRRLDPANTFRFNHNIDPGGQPRGETQS